jgi:hypothetical protein
MATHLLAPVRRKTEDGGQDDTIMSDAKTLGLTL